jgi:replicative DNA helicase
MASNSSSSRIPPHSLEAEESVLGAILLDENAINTALERLKADDFYRSANRAIFQAMTNLIERREPIDAVTLSQELKTMSLLEQSGGIDNINRLASLVPSAANIGYYADTVKEMSVRRKVIHESSKSIEQAFQIDSDFAEFIDQTEQRILGVSDSRVDQRFFKVGDIVQDSIKTIEYLYDRKEAVTGIPSGFKDLDQMTAGLQSSDLVIIAARPAMGKTSLALSVAQWVGIHKNIPTAIFSLEMSKEQLVLRMLCSEARVENTKVRTGRLGERDFPKLVDAASKLAEAPIYIDDTPAAAVSEVRAKARRLSREAKLGLIVIDYLQLMKSPMYSKSREQEIADISRSLKALAKELNIPVIALSQLNRSVEQRTDKRPLMSDLRESGAIEQDADIIVFIYREEVYNEQPEEKDKGVAELIIAKHRSGPTGTVRLAFSSQYTRFDNLEERYGSESGDTNDSEGYEQVDLSSFDSDLF